MSENSHYYYQVAPDMAMTVRLIMILPYVARRDTRRGEIPVKQTSNLLLSDFPIQGVLRTNIVNNEHFQPETVLFTRLISKSNKSLLDGIKSTPSL